MVTVNDARGGIEFSVEEGDLDLFVTFERTRHTTAEDFIAAIRGLGVERVKYMVIGNRNRVSYFQVEGLEVFPNLVILSVNLCWLRSVPATVNDLKLIESYVDDDVMCPNVTSLSVEVRQDSLIPDISDIGTMFPCVRDLRLLGHAPALARESYFPMLDRLTIDTPITGRKYASSLTRIRVTGANEIEGYKESAICLIHETIHIPSLVELTFHRVNLLPLHRRLRLERERYSAALRLACDSVGANRVMVPLVTRHNMLVVPHDDPVFTQPIYHHVVPDLVAPGGERDGAGDSPVGGEDPPV